MRNTEINIVFLGLSITSSWGNGHATTYRALVEALCSRGHRVLFLERDQPWYAQNRDLTHFEYCRVGLYDSLDDLRTNYVDEVRKADLVVVGSFVPEGIAVGDWVIETAQGITAFYDIDTPVTLASLRAQGNAYLEIRQIPLYHLYLSFSGGPVLKTLEDEFGSPCARPLYCSFDPSNYYPERAVPRWNLGYLGTYSEDRMAGLQRFLIGPANRCPELRMVVAGSQYPEHIVWPDNVERKIHIPPSEHRRFYTNQLFSLNVTRDDMVRTGYSPSVRLFEAAGCGVPVISDRWQGIEEFFEPGREILLVNTEEEAIEALTALPERERKLIGSHAHSRAISEHTSFHRAVSLEGYTQELSGKHYEFA